MSLRWEQGAWSKHAATRLDAETDPVPVALQVPLSWAALTPRQVTQCRQDEVSPHKQLVSCLFPPAPGMLLDSSSSKQSRTRADAISVHNKLSLNFGSSEISNQ